MPDIQYTRSKQLIPSLNRLLAGCHTLLDVGAGTGETLAALAVPFKLGLDIHRPYLESWPAHEESAIPLHLSAHSLGRIFLPQTVDAVTFIDSLEHLPRQEALKILAAAERIARRLVLVFTPRGFFPQAGFDAKGMGGEKYQWHRSRWEPRDFLAVGFDVLVFKAFHDADNESFQRAFGPGAPPLDALLAHKHMEREHPDA